MLHALTVRSDEDKVGPSSWSAPSSPIPTLYTGGTAKSTISPVGVNLLPTFPDHHSTSVKRPCLQQQFIPRCPVDAATPGNPETSLSFTESHEKVDKSGRFRRIRKLLSYRKKSHKIESTLFIKPYVRRSIPSGQSHDAYWNSLSPQLDAMNLMTVFNCEPTNLDLQSEFEKTLRCGVDVAILYCSVNSKKRRSKGLQQAEAKTLFLGGYGRDKHLGSCSPCASRLSCRDCHCMKLDDIQSISVVDPSDSLLRNEEQLKGTCERDNRRVISLVGSSCAGKKKELTIFLNDDMVDDIIWHGFVNLEHQLLFNTLEMSGSDITCNLSQSASFL